MTIIINHLGMAHVLAAPQQTVNCLLPSCEKLILLVLQVYSDVKILVHLSAGL